MYYISISHVGACSYMIRVCVSCTSIDFTCWTFCPSCRIFHGHSTERSHVPLLCYTPRSTTHQKHPLNITNCTMTRIIQGSEFDISWYYLALRLWKDSHAQMAYLPPLPPCSLAALQPRGGPQKLQHASGGCTLHQIRGNYGELEVAIGFPKGAPIIQVVDHLKYDEIMKYV